MKREASQALTVIVSALVLVAGAHAAEPDGANAAAPRSVPQRVEHGAKRALDLTRHGLQRGADATVRGVKRGADATRRGVETGAHAVSRVAHKVADKL